MKTPYTQGFEAGIAWAAELRRQAYWQGNKDGLETALAALEAVDFDYFGKYGMIQAKTALKMALKSAPKIDEMELPTPWERT